ncbi:threonine/homoserine exporter RhtA [Pseudomonas typographi]|uniref:Threonine/homoserine exporter RhtA n=1 Tax=Pseudomonas typographi TaxID=2715964 RepID=A0ABR7Z745_9PSED|nr:threonine/homoserine exporter RhtA [Pseudomonas typographi]MBD1554040.1 threonine/homoserine exporter RhtA [Pseudomonas typographi]MBD1601244.1 threonine/homoserine exporter RhtA [Pseudomonas typographi]
MPAPNHATSSTLLPIGLLLIAMASIQFGATLAKGLFPLVGAQGTTTLRLAIAAVLMVLILRPWRLRLGATALKHAALYGLALGGMNFFFYMAVRSVPLGIAVALEFTGPLAVAIASSRKRIDFLWIALAIVGLALLVPLGATQQGIDPIGVYYALGAGVCWALYIVFGQKAGQGHGVQMASLGVLFAALVIAPIGIAHAGSALLSWALLPAALGVAVLSTALPYSLEMIALTRLPARTFGTLMSLEPAVAALSGLMVLGEHLSPTQWLAIGSIIIASVGAALTQGGTQPPALAAD